MICQTDGLVLRGFRMSESSKVVVLFSRDYGKLRLVAKAHDGPKANLARVLNP